MSSGSATINNVLTTYARGIAAEARKNASLIDRIAPVIETGAATGRYKLVSDKNSLQAVDARRGVGGKAKRLEYDTSEGTYSCEPYALEIPIDDHEKKLAGDEGLALLKQGKTAALLNTHITTREDAIFGALKGSVAATGGVGAWSSGTAKPIDELDALIESIATKCGLMPNNIVFGLGAWRVFRSHDNVRKYLPSSTLGVLTPDAAGGLFLNPEIKVGVGVLSKDTGKYGSGKNAVNIIGSDIWLFYSARTPGLFDQSFAKTFRMRGDGVMAVTEYRAQDNRSDILAIDWTEQFKVTNAEAGARVTLS